MTEQDLRIALAFRFADGLTLMQRRRGTPAGGEYRDPRLFSDDPADVRAWLAGTGDPVAERRGAGTALDLWPGRHGLLAFDHPTRTIVSMQRRTDLARMADVEILGALRSPGGGAVRLLALVAAGRLHLREPGGTAVRFRGGPAELERMAAESVHGELGRPVVEAVVGIGPFEDYRHVGDGTGAGDARAARDALLGLGYRLTGLAEANWGGAAEAARTPRRGGATEDARAGSA